MARDAQPELVRWSPPPPRKEDAGASSGVLSFQPEVPVIGCCCFFVIDSLASREAVDTVASIQYCTLVALSLQVDLYFCCAVSLICLHKGCLSALLETPSAPPEKEVPNLALRCGRGPSIPRLKKSERSNIDANRKLTEEAVDHSTDALPAFCKRGLLFPHHLHSFPRCLLAPVTRERDLTLIPDAVRRIPSPPPSCDGDHRPALQLHRQPTSRTALKGITTFKRPPVLRLHLRHGVPFQIEEEPGQGAAEPRRAAARVTDISAGRIRPCREK